MEFRLTDVRRGSIAMWHSLQSCKQYTCSVHTDTQAYCFSPEPKTQREARKRCDADDWIQCKYIEMDTVYNMGTIEYVAINSLPKGTTLIPTKFAYTCKFGDVGQIMKKKARLCV